MTDDPYAGYFADRPERPAKLTRRERDVLRAFSVGMNGTETAHILGISWHTVRNHHRSARMKLGAKTVTHAVANAIRADLI